MPKSPRKHSMKGKPNEKVLYARCDALISWKETASVLGISEESLKAELQIELSEERKKAITDAINEAVRLRSAKREENARRYFKKECTWCIFKRKCPENYNDGAIASCTLLNKCADQNHDNWEPDSWCKWIAWELASKDIQPQYTDQIINTAKKYVSNCLLCRFSGELRSDGETAYCQQSKKRKHPICQVCKLAEPSIEAVRMAIASDFP